MWFFYIIIISIQYIHLLLINYVSFLFLIANNVLTIIYIFLYKSNLLCLHLIILNYILFLIL